MNYHYGITIKEYREKLGFTQSHLAEIWPKSGGDIGVSSDYVSLVETGKKRITDVKTLRRLCGILKIPYWKMGLSEYDPFGGTGIRGVSMYDETLNTAEGLIKRTWWVRRTAPVPYVRETVDDLNRLFAYMQENMPPPIRLEERTQILYAQVLRLNAIVAVEHQQYEEALHKFEQMYLIAKNIDHPATLAIALLGRGTELNRLQRYSEAIESLEAARDESFRASKHIIALVNAYLARAYASIQRAKEFKRTITIAQKVATDIQLSYGDGTDFVFHSLSGILAERSYGYLEIGEPQETLKMRDEIKQQIAIDFHLWLDSWIPLDWARAHLMLGEIDQCVEASREFYRKATSLKSPHAQSNVFRLLNTMEFAGFKDTPSVQAFRAEIHTQENSMLDPGDHYPLL